MSNGIVSDELIDPTLDRVFDEVRPVGAVHDEMDLVTLVARLNDAKDPRARSFQLYRNMMHLRAQLLLEQARLRE